MGSLKFHKLFRKTSPTITYPHTTDPCNIAYSRVQLRITREIDVPVFSKFMCREMPVKK